MGKVKLTLTEIFRRVAVAKKVKNPEKWVAEKLQHCQVDSDYLNYIHLVSNKKMFFGVLDAEFSCNSFIVYREGVDNGGATEVKEFELYTFEDLKNPKFLTLVKESYRHFYDSVKDFRLFYLGSPVPFQVVSEGKACVLGEFNDLDDMEVWVDIYTLYHSPTAYEYYRSKNRLELDLVKMQPVSCAFKVIRMGKEIPFEIRRLEGNAPPAEVIWL